MESGDQLYYLEMGRVPSIIFNQKLLVGYGRFLESRDFLKFPVLEGVTRDISNKDKVDSVLCTHRTSPQQHPIQVEGKSTE